MSKRVAIVGLSFRFPGTDTVAYWDDLLSGKDLVTEVDAQRWSKDAYLHPDKTHTGTAYTFAAGSIGDISRFDAAFFGISPREAALMDPQQRILLEMCWEAIEHAGIQPGTLRGSDTGVYIGIASADYSYRLSDDFDAIDASFATGNTASIAANRLSYAFDLRGPSMAVDTACSSSLVAFHQACRAVASGEVTHAIAGGISLHLHPYGFITFSKASMLSRRGRCSVFDAAGDGYVRSEGGGLFVLKDYDQAVADGDRIIGIVAHSAVNTDGKKSGLTVPSADAQIALMQRAYADAGVSPADLDYLEAHGTGTAVGDPIETLAIGRALGQQRKTPLPIGSVKSNMGHLEAASGVAGLVKALYCLQRREVPATIGIETPNPAIKFDEWNLDVVTATRPLKSSGPLTIGVNSFGFGGANAHIILQSHERSAAETPGLMTATGLPIVVSGKSAAALSEAAARYAAALETLAPSALYDFAYQANYRREWHDHRAVVFGSSARTMSQNLSAFAQGKAHKFDVPSGTRVPHAKGAAFVYSGNGSQWSGMGRALLEDPVFAEAIADIDVVFAPLAGYSLADEFAGTFNDPKRYQRTEYAQPALFAVQVGMTRMLMQAGIHPTAVIGHSVGEVAAAWACGALSLSQATRVIYHRSRLQGTTRGNGAMTAVGINGAATQALLDALALSGTVNVAGYNSARGATVAGHPDDLAALERVLAERQIFFKRLDLDYAFHSPAMDSIETPLRAVLSDLVPGESHIPFYSAVTGQVASGTELGADYWWQNIRAAVQFENAARALVADGVNVHVEIGPHPVLRGYISDALKAATLEGRVVTTGMREDDAPKRIRACAGLLLIAGAHADLSTFFPVAGRHVELPAYPWQREAHWHAISPEARNSLFRVRTHPLLGWPLRDHEAAWENHIDTRIQPSLADHVVGHATVFPGTGFVEMALAAAFAHQHGDYAVVEEIEIRAPLLLEADHTKIVRLVLEPADGRFAITAKTHGAEDGFAPHATGRILAEPKETGLTQAPVAWPTRAPDFVGADHTALTEMVGLSYGPAYRAVAHGWNESADRVLACFQPDASITEALETSHLHPALLDNAFQLIIQLLKHDPAMHTGVAFVPAKVGRVVVRAGVHIPFAARATLLRRTPHGLVARFEMFDAEGVVIASIDEARFKSIRLQKLGSEQLSFLDYRAIPANRHTGAQSIGAVAETLSPERIAESLRSRLLNGGTEIEAQRFATEVDPLADALVAQFVREALIGLADEKQHLSSGYVQTLRQQHPGRAALLNMLLTRSVDEDGARATATGWTFDIDPQQPPAADIWNSLVREYPDYFAVVQAIGRVGLHLQDLINDRVALDHVLPREASPAILAGHIQGVHARQALTGVLADYARQAQAVLPPGERLRVLEIGEAEPLAGAGWCHSLDASLSDYRFVSANSDAVAAAQRLKEAYPEIEVQDIGVVSDDGAPFDLAFIDIALVGMDAADRYLRYAQQRLKPGAALILLNSHPSNWLDAVFGADESWWA